jgi:hypothetical protein
MGGKVTTTLMLPPNAGPAVITATVESVMATTLIHAVYPAVKVLVTPSRPTIYRGDTVTYTYQVTNTGDVTLTAVRLVDDNGTLGNSGDDLTIFANITMARGTAVSYSRSATLTRTLTNTVIVTSQDPLNNQVTDSDWATVKITPIEVYLPIVIRHN